MDKIKRILFIAFSAAVLMVAACKHDVTTGTVKGDGITADKTVTLNLSTNGDYTVFSTKNNSSSRTIVSNPYTADDLDFYLYGTNTTKGTYVGLQKITVNADGTGKKGTASLEIGSYVWELTIVAYQTSSTELTTQYSGPSTEAALLADAVLVGRASADLRGDTNKVDFVLMPDGLTKVGNVSIKLYTGGWQMNSAYTAKVGIYDHETGTEISALTEPKAPASTEKVFDSTSTLIPDSVPGSANYEAASLVPGNCYDLVVEFSSGTGKKYYWSDNLVVLPGKGNTETVIIPNTIMLPPDPPTAFNAGYFEPSSDIASMYQVEFTWTRSAGKTEKYYELQIADIGIPDDNLDADDTNDKSYSKITTDVLWDQEICEVSEDGDPDVPKYSALTTVSKYGMDFYQNPFIWVAGSLLKGNETATAKLVLGKRYAVRIRAVNDAGVSAWAYATLDGNTTTGSTAFTSNLINLFRITYQKTDTNGRLATYTATPAFENVQYYNQSETTGIAIAIPYRSAEEEADTSVTRDVTVKDPSNAYWAYWKNYNETNQDPENYTGFENLTLIPVFAKQSDITIFDDTENLMSKDNITLTKVTGTGTLGTIDANNSVEIDLNTIKSIKWALTYPTGKVYDYCYLTLAKTSSYNAFVYNENIDQTTKEFPVMDLTDCESVKYMAVIHYGIDGKDYTLPILVSIVE